METLKENILDPPQKELSKEIFIKEVMKGQVKNYLIDTILKWLKKQGYEKELIKSIHLIGSSASKNYTDASDIDVSIDSKIDPNWIKANWKFLPNGNVLPGTKHPINYYLTSDDKDVRESVAAYNILTDKWHHKQDDKEKVFPINYAYEVAKFFIAGFDARISEYELDNKELEYLKAIDAKTIEMTDEELQQRISQKEMEIYSDLDSIAIGHELLKAFRKLPYEDKKTDTLLSIEVKQKSNTLNNLVYKIIMDKMNFEEVFEKYDKIREQLKKKNEN